MDSIIVAEDIANTVKTVSTLSEALQTPAAPYILAISALFLVGFFCHRLLNTVNSIYKEIKDHNGNISKMQSQIEHLTITTTDLKITTNHLNSRIDSLALTKEKTI